MNTVRRTPTRTLSIALLAATLAAVVTFVLSGGPAAAAHGPTHVTASSVAEAAFAAEMRRLWFEHVHWTRLAIVSFAAGLPDLQPTLNRLLRNQNDIGSAIAPYYGAKAGKRLTSLLRAHILGAVDVLEAAKAGSAASLARAQRRWNANSDSIAAFLSSANPQHWPQAVLRGMLRAHLAVTTKEAVARLEGRWAADIKAADEVERQMLHMADALSAGIVAQFPDRFERS
jgi:hypothetical protein